MAICSMDRNEANDSSESLSVSSRGLPPPERPADRARSLPGTPSKSLVGLNPSAPPPGCYIDFRGVLLLVLYPALQLPDPRRSHQGHREQQPQIIGHWRFRNEGLSLSYNWQRLRAEAVQAQPAGLVGAPAPAAGELPSSARGILLHDLLAALHQHARYRPYRILVDVFAG